MAASVTTLATTLEGQILELITTANDQESALPEESNQGRFTVSVDTEANEITVSATLLVNITTGANGVTLAAEPYLP